MVSGTPELTKNNGDVRTQRISVPAIEQTPAQTFTQTYSYDALSRLSAAGESNASGPTWAQVYTYDRYGNRRLDSDQTTTPKLTGQQQTALPSVANPAIESPTNRIAEAQGGTGQKEYTYDAAGNLTCDAAHCAPAAAPTPYYDYDGESKMARAGGGRQVGGAEYVYDGGGQRVQKVAGAVTTVFVYDAAGRLAAEYGNEPRAAQTSDTSYITQDVLGSTRVVTGQQQEVKGRHDYLPFGEEATAERSGYGSSSVRQRYTGYERDETDLDYAEARYYVSSNGRFSSPDPLLSSAKRGTPQSWNRYVYCLDNPLIYVDPSGLDWVKNKDSGYVMWLTPDPNDPNKPIDTKTFEILTGDELNYNISATQSVRLHPGGPKAGTPYGSDDWKGWHLGEYIPGAPGFVEEAQSHVTNTLGFGPGLLQGTGGLVSDSESLIKPTVGFSFGPSPSFLSYSHTRGGGNVAPGIYFTYTVIPVVTGIAGSSPIYPTFDPLNISPEYRYEPSAGGAHDPPVSMRTTGAAVGTPQASVGVQLVFPGMTGAVYDSNPRHWHADHGGGCWTGGHCW